MRVINDNNKTTINNSVQKIKINNFQISIYLRQPRHNKKCHLKEQKFSKLQC